MARVWPSMTDYSAAVQDPETSFRVPELARAEFATMPPLGLPAIASGQNAVVFNAIAGGRTTAVRCFTTEPSHGRVRYRALERHLAARPVPAMAAASWVDDAIDVGDRLWPVVTMEWIEGVPLHEHVAAGLGDSTGLTGLARDWLEVCRSLRVAAVAHGDLQHGNVMVDPRGRIRLIDFDGVWLPEVASLPPSETGHPNYQHPLRAEDHAWGWSIDWFSALVIMVSLRALAVDASLWESHHGENLIFSDEDFRGDTEIWSRLERSGDPEVRRLSSLLAEGCAHRADAPYDLDTIIHRGLVAVDPPDGVEPEVEPGRIVETPPGSPVRPPARAVEPSRASRAEWKPIDGADAGETTPSDLGDGSRPARGRSPAAGRSAATDHRPPPTPVGGAAAVSRPSSPPGQSPGSTPGSGPTPPRGLGLSRAGAGRSQPSPQARSVHALSVLMLVAAVALVIVAVALLV